MRHYIILATAFIGLSTAFATAFATPIKWTCRLPEAAARSFTMYHGETLEFQPEFIVDGAPLTNVTALSIYWQTNGMGTVWWSAPGTTFGPSNDVGAASYRFFIRAESSDGILYRANGTIRMLASPGFVPAEVELPAKVLDFSSVDYRNAPWADADDLAALRSRHETDHVDTLGQIAAAARDVAELKSEIGGKQDELPLSGGVYGITVGTAWNAYYAELSQKAISDSSGNDIVDTYATKEENAAKADASAVETLGANVGRLMLQVLGSNVWFSVTNYFGSLALPSLSLHERVDGVDTVVWDERTRHNETRQWCIDEVTDMLESLMDAIPYKAWGLYTSATGAPAPSNTTWMSSGSLVIASGFEFRSYGTVAVLESNGMMPASAVNTNGYSEIRTLEGETMIEWRKTQERLVPARPTAMQQAPNGDWMIPFDMPSDAPFDANNPPILYGAQSVTGPWHAETNSLAQFTVTWSGDASEKTWLAVARTSAPYSMFLFMAKVNAPGRSETRIPGILNAEGGILCTDGRHVVRPVYSDGTVTWVVEDLDGAAAAAEVSQ